MIIKNEFTFYFEFYSFSLIGNGVRNFLHGQTTNDILGCKDNERIFTCWLSTNGELKNILEITIIGEEAKIVVILGDAESIYNGFNKVIFPNDKVNLMELKLIKSLRKLNKFESWRESFKKSDSVNDDKLNEKNADNQDYHRLRHENGLILDFNETLKDLNPFEIGLVDLLSYSKGCYLGQEFIARFSKNKEVRRELRYWKSREKIDVGENLYNDKETKKSCGKITSSVKIDENEYIGYAILKKDYFNKKSLYSEKFYYLININRPNGFMGFK